MTIHPSMVIETTDAEAPQRPARTPRSGGGAGDTTAQVDSAYSKVVKLMRLLLPVIAVGLVAMVLIWPLFQEDEGFRIGLAVDDVQGAAEDPSMLNARYMGIDQQDQPFQVSAKSARPSEGSALIDGEATIIDLEAPEADITLKDGTWLALTADSGQYRKEEHNLDLEGSVNLFHDDGYEFRTDSALVDLQSGAAISNDIVVGQGPGGVLHSEGVVILDRGERIVFTGPARLVLYSDPPKPVK